MQCIRHAVYYLVRGTAVYRVIKETERYCARKAIQAKVQGLVYKAYKGTRSAVQVQCTRTGYSSQCAMCKKAVCMYVCVQLKVLCTVQGPWDDGTADKDKCKHTQGTTHGTGTLIHPGGGKFGIALVCTHLGT